MLDETKKAEKDSLQEPGKAPASEDGNTPEPEVFTKAQVDEAIQKDRIQRGRDVKALTDREVGLDAREEAIKAQQAEIDEIKRQRDEAELAEARGDPTKMRAYQTRKSREQEDVELKAQRDALKKDRAILDRDKAEHEAEVKVARETQLEIEIWKIAEAEGVDPVELKDMMKDFNLTTVEQAKTAAKRLNKKPVDETTKKPLIPVTGVTSGGPGEKSEEKKLKERYPTMK